MHLRNYKECRAEGSRERLEEGVRGCITKGLKGRDEGVKFFRGPRKCLELVGNP